MIYLTAGLDILIVALFIYGLMALLTRSRYTFVFNGLFILGLIYITAYFLELQLTLTFFKYFFGFLVLGLVVVFQEEIRRFFEVISFWSRWRLSRNKRAELRAVTEVVEALVSVVMRLAEQKIGMLVVLRGREPLLRHLSGGFDLNGELSEPLLQSIFDPSSPGHDGAVVIEGNKVIKFGVHLPLSQDFDQIKQYGTRHSAALGLAEKSDALIVVVSEERGKISLARDGALKTMKNEEDLQKDIKNFLSEKFQLGEDRFKFLKANWEYKGLALVTSGILWFIFY